MICRLEAVLCECLNLDHKHIFLLSPGGEIGTSRRVYPLLAPTGVLVGIADINREVDIQSQNRKWWNEKQRIG